mmetsp:Transcript_59003/g.116874  ORF Transcript_59003/g.116874 Transcript_59003/m.116874 type:complete len:190 (-) Transcript_59003:87-656(-)
MFPMLHVEMVPTDYALRMRPAFIGMLIALIVIVFGKLMIHDFWGAISVLCVVIMGFFVLSGEYKINASSALFYCVMAMISGIFDVISCILYFQHSKYRLAHTDAPWIVLLAQAVFILSPVALMASAVLSYNIFSDCRDHAEETMPMRAGGALDYTSLLDAGQPPAQSQHGQPGVIVPFQGRGQRLSGDA